MRRTGRVLEDEVFCLNLFSGETDGQVFGRRSFFLFEFTLAVRLTDRVLKEEVFFAFI